MKRKWQQEIAEKDAEIERINGELEASQRTEDILHEKIADLKRICARAAKDIRKAAK